jgi:hypothetical protein
VCFNRIDRKVMEVSKDFPCPHCQRLVRTTKLFRVFMSVFAFALATLVVVFSPWPLLGKIIAWPILWYVFTMLYIWMASIARQPQLIVSQDGDKRHEPFQGLGLR